MATMGMLAKGKADVGGDGRHETLTPAVGASEAK
jgi:hypothetical protein